MLGAMTPLGAVLIVALVVGCAVVWALILAVIWR
jgi:hypothetical protein